MYSKAPVVLASLVALIVTVACGDSKPHVSPSPVSPPGTNGPSPNPPAPTPNPPAPTPNPPTPTPNPPAPTPNPPNPPTPGEAFSFTADTTSPGARSYSLAAAGMIDGDYYVALNG